MVKKADEASAIGKVRFFYIKGNHFRVIHVDGALGGVTSRGLIHCAVYSERAAIPQTAEHDVSAEGKLGPPASQEGKQGIVRELDADLMMTKQTAAELRDWLTARIEDIEQIEKTSGITKPIRRGKKNALR